MMDYEGYMRAITDLVDIVIWSAGGFAVAVIAREICNFLEEL